MMVEPNQIRNSPAEADSNLAGLPSVSIIMPTINAAATIEASLKSIVPQKGHFSELIVADGGSQDSTRELAARYGANVLDGDDTGLYAGLNRGLRAAKGDYILFLNADDLLAENALEVFYAAFEKGPHADLYSGKAEVFGNIKAKYCPESKLSLENALFGVPVPNARFYKRSTLLEIGGFREDVGLAADRLLLITLAAHMVKGVALSGLIYRYQSHIGSFTLGGDAPSKSRVHQADFRLLTALSEMQIPTHLLEAYRTLQLLRLSGFAAIKSTPHLIRSVIYWAKWRGKMTGF